MNINVPTVRYTVPTAFVTKGRQRVKQYNNTSVYLNNGDEFEIELFNPTVNKVMAKIDLNGVSIGPGVVLRPGERVFLERYLSEAKKFRFETYEVDGNDENVQKAIANNGDVVIKFYCEEILQFPVISPTIWTTTCWPPQTPYTPYTYTYFNNTSPANNGIFTSSSSCFGTKGHTLEYASGQGETIVIDNAPEQMSRDIVDAPFDAASKSVETGRIERGSNSNQSFGYDRSNFHPFWSWKTEWKILPMSQKPIMREDLVVFCHSCGMKRKKNSFKYCSNCGTQY